MSYIQNTSAGGAGSGTVTNTGGALTNNAVVLGAGGNDTKVSTGIVTNGVAELDVGVAGTSGVIGLNGTTSGKATLTAPAVAGTVTNGVATSNAILGPDGTAALPTWGFSSTRNCGMALIGGGLGVVGSSQMNLYTGAGNTLQMQLSGTGNLAFVAGKGQHFNTQAANNDHCGTFATAASTTASVTFTTNYTSTPVVVLTPQTTGLTSWFISAISNSGFTVTVAPSGTYTFGYIVVGNPN